MDAIKAKRLVNTLLFFGVCGLAGSGFAMEFRDAHGVGELHFIMGIAVTVLVAVHVYLSRNWVIGVLSRGHPRRALGLLGAGLVVFSAVFVLAPAGEEEEGQHRGDREHHEHHDDD